MKTREIKTVYSAATSVATLFFTASSKNPD